MYAFKACMFRPSELANIYFNFFFMENCLFLLHLVRKGCTYLFLNIVKIQLDEFVKFEAILKINDFCQYPLR